MSTKDRIKFIVCPSGASNDNDGPDPSDTKRDPLDPRLLTLARIVAHQAVGDYLAAALDDAASDAANDNEPLRPDEGISP